MRSLRSHDIDTTRLLISACAVGNGLGFAHFNALCSNARICQGFSDGLCPLLGQLGIHIRTARGIHKARQGDFDIRMRVQPCCSSLDLRLRLGIQCALPRRKETPAPALHDSRWPHLRAAFLRLLQVATVVLPVRLHLLEICPAAQPVNCAG